MFELRTNELPPRIILYGTQGVGKTKLASTFPNPVFLQLEDGLGNLQVHASPLITSVEMFYQALDSLKQPNNFTTLVVDSIDWLERLFWQDICRKQNLTDIKQLPYGRGYAMANAYWNVFINRLNVLRDKGMIILLLVHSQVKRIELPGSDPYDRYLLDIHKEASAVLSEWCDCLFFMNYEVSVVKTESGFGAIHTKALGDGSRKIFTSEKPAYSAKNRYSLPASMSIETGAPEKFWPELRNLIKNQ